MTSASVSILIPAFNAERWIGAAIDSAVHQTWPSKEIIIVDDGSTDRTAAVAARFASEQVRVVSQKNAGAASARNHAYSLSRGDYIQWLDADDLLAPDKIAAQMRVVNAGLSPRTLLSGAFSEFIHRPAKATSRETELWKDLSPTEWVLAKFERNLYMSNATWLVSRDLAETAGPWDTRLALDDDGEYFCRVVLASDGVRFVPDAHVYYRRANSGSLSYVGPAAAKLDSQFESLAAQIRSLRAAEESERVRRACVKFLQTWAIYFYPERMDLFREVQQLASALGGEVQVPRLTWKYTWLEKLFGWPVAKRTQMYYNQLKWSVIRSYDKALFELERRNPIEAQRLR